MRFILDSGEVLELPSAATGGAAIIRACGGAYAPYATIPAKRLAITRQGYAVPLQDTAMVYLGGADRDPFEVSVVCLDDVRSIREGLTSAATLEDETDRLEEFKRFI